MKRLLRSELAQEKQARGDSGLKIRKRSQEVEKAQRELKSLKTQLRETKSLMDSKNKGSIIKLK